MPVGHGKQAERTRLSATFMLTLIAFRLALGSSVLPLAYPTELDVFTIGATVLVFTALAQAMVTTALWERERKQLAQHLNAVSRVFFPAAFVVLVMLFSSRFKILV
jgi:hypothetical protein